MCWAGITSFDPRPREGGDDFVALLAVLGQGFDPRPREGGDCTSPSTPPPSRAVSIHAPAKGATVSLARARVRISRFDPRPREGGDKVEAAQIARTAGFRSTPPRRGRLPERIDERMSDGFDPRPREGGDLSSWRSYAVSARFDPRPREGGDQAFLDLARKLLVSIHAPAKGASALDMLNLLQMPFRSTPPRRGRRRRTMHRAPGQQVSIHAPAKGATRRQGVLRTRFCVSIHAPAKGATRAFPAQFGLPNVSIHAPAKGATCRLEPVGVGGTFRSTPPRRGRHRDESRRDRFARFDPRPREGGDSASDLLKQPAPVVSIHAPAKGATLYVHCALRGRAVSIHAPAKGATRRQFRDQSGRRVSIHAPAKGATTRAPQAPPRSRCFDPRPREGGDRCDFRGGIGVVCFDPRPREGGD